MNPEGPTHMEEGGGRTGGDCMSPCSNVCGSAGWEEKHSLLNPTALDTFAPTLPSSCYKQKGGMEHNNCISPKAYVQVQESGWKMSVPHTTELPAILSMVWGKDFWQAALWMLLPFSHFFQASCLMKRGLEWYPFSCCPLTHSSRGYCSVSYLYPKVQWHRLTLAVGYHITPTRISWSVCQDFLPHYRRPLPVEAYTRALDFDSV